MSTLYINLSELGDLQEEVMKVIEEWVHVKKTPVPLKEVIAIMEIKGSKKKSTIYSLSILIKKGYIRRAYTISNKTSFVQLRTL